MGWYCPDKAGRLHRRPSPHTLQLRPRRQPRRHGQPHIRYGSPGGVRAGGASTQPAPTTRPAPQYRTPLPRLPVLLAPTQPPERKSPHSSGLLCQASCKQRCQNTMQDGAKSGVRLQVRFPIRRNAKAPQCGAFGFQYGGEGGIRTLDTVSRIHTFQACSFNRSDTSPYFLVGVGYAPVDGAQCSRGFSECKAFFKFFIGLGPAGERRGCC